MISGFADEALADEADTCADRAEAKREMAKDPLFNQIF